MKYTHETYTLNLPDDWTHEEDEECTSFYSPNAGRSLHISDYFKEEGEVTLEDIQELAQTQDLEKTNLPFLHGVSQKAQEDDDLVLTWWLYIENHFLLVEYICSPGDEKTFAQEIEDLVYSIRSFAA